MPTVKKCRSLWCSRPAAPDRASCKYHLELNRTKQVRYRRERVAAGLCKRCGKHPPRPGKSNCQVCYDGDHARHIQTYSTGQHLYQRRRAQGLCPTCGESPDPGSVSCEPCKAKRRASDLLRRMGSLQMQILERDSHTCQLCGKQMGLVVHHIDGMGNGSGHPNDDPDNLITLCRNCHSCISYLRSDRLPRALVIELLAATPSPSVAELEALYDDAYFAAMDHVNIYKA